MEKSTSLSAEAVEGLALALEGVDHIHGGDGLAASVLGVRRRVTHHALDEALQAPAHLTVDEARQALRAGTAGQAADRTARHAIT